MNTARKERLSTKGRLKAGRCFLFSPFERKEKFLYLDEEDFKE
jgi:hypothetical protein